MFQILVVEDDRSTARLMQAVLRHGGYEVVEAGNGIEALAVMDTQHIDLIVLDQDPDWVCADAGPQCWEEGISYRFCVYTRCSHRF